jgi:mono/diheme cytochrome c family protein
VRSALLVCLLACQPGNSAPAPSPPPVEKPVAPPVDRDGAAAQVARGKQVFADNCSECHGAAGEGTDDGPRLVGTGVLALEAARGSKRDVKFRTAGDVYAFAMRKMPADDPASLTADQYLAVVAYVLSANGATLDQPLDADRARAIVLHP